MVAVLALVAVADHKLMLTSVEHMETPSLFDELPDETIVLIASVTTGVKARNYSAATCKRLRVLVEQACTQALQMRHLFAVPIGPGPVFHLARTSARTAAVRSPMTERARLFLSLGRDGVFSDLPELEVAKMISLGTGLVILGMGCHQGSNAVVEARTFAAVLNKNDPEPELDHLDDHDYYNGPYNMYGPAPPPEEHDEEDQDNEWDSRDGPCYREQRHMPYKVIKNGRDIFKPRTAQSTNPEGTTHQVDVPPAPVASVHQLSKTNGPDRRDGIAMMISSASLGCPEILAAGAIGGLMNATIDREILLSPMYIPTHVWFAMRLSRQRAALPPAGPFVAAMTDEIEMTRPQIDRMGDWEPRTRIVLHASSTEVLGRAELRYSLMPFENASGLTLFDFSISAAAASDASLLGAAIEAEAPERVDETRRTLERVAQPRLLAARVLLWRGVEAFIASQVGDDMPFYWKLRVAPEIASQHGRFFAWRGMERKGLHAQDITPDVLRGALDLEDRVAVWLTKSLGAEDDMALSDDDDDDDDDDDIVEVVDDVPDPFAPWDAHQAQAALGRVDRKVQRRRDRAAATRAEGLTGLLDEGEDPIHIPLDDSWLVYPPRAL